jgi:peroxiredoxin
MHEISKEEFNMGLSIGDSAPDFNLIGVDDQTHNLNDFSDKAALAVIFSCNHCPYVRAWEDRMVKLQADYADKGVQLIAINANDAVSHPSDSFESMKIHHSEQGFKFLYLHDKNQDIAKAYGAQRTPEVFLFGKDRTLAYHGAIDDNYEHADAAQAHYLQDALDAVLSGQSPPTPKTDAVGCTIKWK